MATLKNDWQSGEQFNASDANAIATEVNAKYVKPATGVPITDLTASVQVSLGKADTAIQAVAAVNISDSTSTGRAVLTAADSSAARTALGVAYGTAAGTVAQGNDSRFSPTATSISDSTATGRAVLTATDASAARSAIGLGSVSLSADDTAAATAAATAKATPVDADVVPLVDSAASNVLKKLSWANLKAAFKAYYDDVTATLTNKTLTSPRINSILDTNGATSLVLNARASAVNYIAVYNEATGVSPAFVTFGSDQNVGLDLAPKGTGAVAIYTQNGITGSTLSATGVGTNKDLNLTTKGTGTVQANGVPVVTTTGTQTLTNKTLTTPAIFKINNLAGGTALATGGAGATAVNWIQVEGAATGSTPAVYGWGTDTNINLNLATKGTGTVQANGVPVVTTTGTAALTNKTISGASNTVTNLPASATPDAARLVCTTQAGGVLAENGANTWAKIATFSPGSLTNQTFSMMLAVTEGNSGVPNNAVLSVHFRTYTSTNPTAAVHIMAEGGGGTSIADDSFKIISGGFGTDMELWFRKAATYGVFSFYEISRMFQGIASLTYHNNAGWQSATPTGAAVNVSSNGVTANGVPVVTESGTQTLTNKTLTSPRINSILDTNGATSLVLNARPSAVNYIRLFNEAAGASPAIVAEGSDTNIGFDIATKGTGAFAIYTPTGITGSTLSATGVGTNKDLNLTTKGTGTVQANGVPVVTTTGTQALSNKQWTSASVPATATSTGTVGQIAYDSSYVYICTAANTWRRAAIAAW